MKSPCILARTPITEIEVEDIGTVRLLNTRQHARVKHTQKHNRHIAPLAFACGMSVRQFKRLPTEKQAEIRAAYCKLTSPANVAPIRP